MKKFVLFSLIMTIAVGISAKKVKFSVDLSNFEISAYGVHVTGDFQTLAGYAGGDWMPNTTQMLQEGESAIYSVVVDIPAHRKYEFRFVNGDQFYETEFVPLESRVGYDFNDNRWIYVDSVSNDTLATGAILFGGNAPRDMVLVRLLVNMMEVGVVSEEGVFADLSEFEPTSGEVKLYTFGGNVYEIIAFVSPGIYEYRFSNGHTPSGFEQVPGECAVNGKRQVDATADIVVETVCFGACFDCTTDAHFLSTESEAVIFPNPAQDQLQISGLKKGNTKIAIINAFGQVMVAQDIENRYNLNLNISRLIPGCYSLIIFGENSRSVKKIIKL